MFPVLLSVLRLVHLKQGTAVVALLLELAPTLPWMLGDQDVMSHCRAVLWHSAMALALILGISFAPFPLWDAGGLGWSRRCWWGPHQPSEDNCWVVRLSWESPSSNVGRKQLIWLLVVDGLGSRRSPPLCPNLLQATFHSSACQTMPPPCRSCCHCISMLDCGVWLPHCFNVAFAKISPGFPSSCLCNPLESFHGGQSNLEKIFVIVVTSRTTELKIEHSPQSHWVLLTKHGHPGHSLLLLLSQPSLCWPPRHCFSPCLPWGCVWAALRVTSLFPWPLWGGWCR